MITADTARVQTHAGGLFEFFDQGQVAHVLDVRDWQGHALDAVAWFPENEGCWWLQTGVGTVLGEDALTECDWHGSGLLLVETPAQWFRERLNGEFLSACILDWSTDVRHLLSRASVVHCRTEYLRQRLRRRVLELAAPPFKIRVHHAA